MFVNRRYFVHLSFAALLLIAQQSVIAHSLWHIGERLSAQAHVELDGEPQSPDRNGDSTQSQLCALHSVMTSQLAGDCVDLNILTTVPLFQWLVVGFPPTEERIAQPVVIPPTRAPPVLL